MGSYKLLMQVLPPRDRMTVFKGQCEATENLGWIFFYLRGTQVCQY